MTLEDYENSELEMEHLTEDERGLLRLIKKPTYV